jgi:hypothetical protein
MSSNSKKDYEIGYGKAPVATRYQRGKSGNPGGRPKKVPELFDPGKLLEAIDNEEVTVTYNGKRKRMTKAEFHFRQLFAKAINGDMKAARKPTKGDMKTARLLAKMAEEYLAPETPGPSDYEVIGTTEATRRFGRNWQKRVDELNAALG